MKEITGYVSHDESRKHWCGRVSLTDPDTGKRKWFKRYGSAKTEARERVRELIARFENEGVHKYDAGSVAVPTRAAGGPRRARSPSLYGRSNARVEARAEIPSSGKTFRNATSSTRDASLKYGWETGSLGRSKAQKPTRRGGDKRRFSLASSL